MTLTILLQCNNYAGKDLDLDIPLDANLHQTIMVNTPVDKAHPDDNLRAATPQKLMFFSPNKGCANATG